MPKHNKITAREKSITKNDLNGSTETSTVARIVEMQMISGPIPPADELAKYESIIPGSAERLLQVHERQITLIEDQSKHRMTLESGVVGGDGKRAWAGLIIGTFVVLSFGWFGYSLAMNGHDWLAGTVFTTAICGPVGVFVYGTNTRRAERSDRLKILAKYRSDQSDQ